MKKLRLFRNLILGLILLSSFVILTPPEPALANWCRWTGTVSYQWEDTGNWDGCGGGTLTPGPGDDVTIYDTAHDPVLAMSVSVAHLVVESQSSLTINYGATLTSELFSLNGVLTGDGDIVVTSAMYWGTVSGTGTDKTMSGGGKTIINAGAVLYIGVSTEYVYPYPTINHRTLENYGSIRPFSEGADLINASNSAMFNIHSGADFWLGYSLNGDTYFHLYDLDHTCTLNNDGTLLDMRDAEIECALNNNGLVEVHYSMKFYRGGTQTGEFKGENVNIYFGDEFHSGQSWNFTTSSKVTVTQVTFCYGTFNFHGWYGPLTDSTATNIMQATFSFFDDATITYLGETLGILDGTLNLPGGSFQTTSLTVYNGTLNTDRILDLQSGNFQGGTLTGFGGLRIVNGKTFSITGSANKNIQLDISNYGTLLWNGGNISGASSAEVKNYGTLDILSGSPLSFTGGSNATLYNYGLLKKRGGSTATIGVTFVNTGTVQIQAGSLNFTSPYTVPPESTLDLAGGTFQATGGTLVNGTLAGSGIVANDVTNNGLVSPGHSAGKISMQNNYTQTISGTLSIDLGGPIPGVDYDQLVITGTAILSGTLEFHTPGSYHPGPGVSFDTLCYGDHSGEFDPVELPGLPPDFHLYWKLVYGSHCLNLSLLQYPLVYLPMVRK